MFRHLISFFLLRAHGSALSMYVHNLALTQVSGRPGLYNEVGFHRLSLSTWFLFIATTYTFVPSCPLFMSSFSCLCCAHTCTIASPNRGRVCVCVPLGIIGILLDGSLFVLLKLAAGDQARYIVAWSTKLAMYLRKWKWDCFAIQESRRKLFVGVLVRRFLSFCFSSILL